MASASLALSTVARLTAPGDNVAIAIHRLEAATRVTLPEGDWPISHTVLEGHRFAIRRIETGEALLSWGLPFGTALRPINPGEYVCNGSILQALAVRRLEAVTLPAEPNFADYLVPFQLDETAFRPGEAVATVKPGRTFLGYRRPGRRGVGTRNVIVILGTTSRTASFARQLASRLQPLARVHPGIDGIVPIAHTEGGGPEEPNNRLEVLRALAGFIVHPNVAAVLAIDTGIEPISNVHLRSFMAKEDYPLEDVPHHFLTLSGGLSAGLLEGERIVRQWLPAANALPRTPEPLSGLRIALQCGGSDAFSGVSGNPLAGAMVHEVIRQGGTGVLTETDEAVGAEAYLVKNCRDLGTARALLGQIDRFRERLSWHGVTAESNPSAGNKLRGLYNISLKSLGAVHKKDPRTRLEEVIDYAAPLGRPGFTFMNGPGNDLEGIAGQVAAGCNLLVFVTGNGSITNFPFVPTLKITTTTRRHQLLIHEMDINAGRYLDGEPMEALTADAVDLLVATASGKKTKGEHAGHSQVSLWRNWRQTDCSRLDALRARSAPDGVPLAIAASDGRHFAPPGPLFLSRADDGRGATEQVGLVLPTSLCAAQIARLAADRLNAKGIGRAVGISRFVALAHTEGCGFGGESMHRLLHRTYAGYLTHPNVVAGLLLEHGCEKVPNDVMRRHLETAGIPLSRFGWSSVQLDGGIEQALLNIERWFAEKLATRAPATAAAADWGELAVGFMTSAPVSAATEESLAAVARIILEAGGSVLLPESESLLAGATFRRELLGKAPAHATLAYGQPMSQKGLHLVASETDHWVENLTGLGGCGAQMALTVVGRNSEQGHPLIPVLQAVEPANQGFVSSEDVDLFLSGDAPKDTLKILELVAAVAQGNLIPAAMTQGFVDFQLTRGLLGVTT